MNELLQGWEKIPESWKTNILIGFVVVQILGRAYHAVRAGGGLVGIWRALVFGTNAPAAGPSTTPNSTRTGPGAVLLLLGLGLAGLLASGCSSTSGVRVLPDGSKLAISNLRLLWASEGIKATTKDLQGFEFSLEVNKSNPDAQALGAVAEGVAKGIATAAKP